MKRYKLLKDLPTFKAGDEFYIDSNNDLRLKGRYIIAYNHYTLEKFPNILKDWFEEIPEEYKRWRAEESCKYWHFDGCGRVDYYYEDGDDDDNSNYAIGNYYGTETEAETHREYLLARQVLLDDAEGGKWKKNGSNYCAYYDYEEDEWAYDDTLESTQTIGIIYFQNPDDIKKSLEKHKEQWEIVRKHEMGEM